MSQQLRQRTKGREKQAIGNVKIQLQGRGGAAVVLTFFLSDERMLTRFSVSRISCPLIFSSIGESVLKDGEWFTCHPPGRRQRPREASRRSRSVRVKIGARSPGTQTNVPAWVFCVSWYVDLEFRVARGETNASRSARDRIGPRVDQSDATEEGCSTRAEIMR